MTADRSPSTFPGNTDLDAVFRCATGASFRARPPRNEELEVLLSVSRAELASLRNVLRLVPGPGPHCMCMGDMELVFHGAKPALLTLHHGYTLRWRGPWEWDDVRIADPQAFIAWLTARGVTQYADDEKKRQQASAAAQQDRDKWLAAAPHCLLALLSVLEGGPSGVPPAPTMDTIASCMAALSATFAGEEDIAIALLRWFGSGKGPWSGYPAYEQIPEFLLMELGTKRLLHSAASRDIDEPTVLGLARYFGSFTHRKVRRRDLRFVSLETRTQMLDALERQGEEGNLERLQSAIRSADQALAQKLQATRTRRRSESSVSPAPDALLPIDPHLELALSALMKEIP